MLKLILGGGVAAALLLHLLWALLRPEDLWAMTLRVKVLWLNLALDALR